MIDEKKFWTEVAKSFDLKLNEIFKIKRYDANVFRITEFGLVLLEKNGHWMNSPLERDLIHNCLTIVKCPWKPVRGEIYYCITDMEEPVQSAFAITWKGSITDYCYFAVGNCFQTKEEACLHMKEIVEKLKNTYNNY